MELYLYAARGGCIHPAHTIQAVQVVVTEFKVRGGLRRMSERRRRRRLHVKYVVWLVCVNGTDTTNLPTPRAAPLQTRDRRRRARLVLLREALPDAMPRAPMAGAAGAGAQRVGEDIARSIVHDVPTEAGLRRAGIAPTRQGGAS